MEIRMTEAQRSCIDSMCDMMVSFLMSVEEVFSDPALGTVVTGRIAEGTVSVGSRVEIVAGDGQNISLDVKEIIQGEQSVRYSEWSGNPTISLRFELLKEGAVRSGDIVAGWTSCGVSPWERDPAGTEPEWC